MRVMLTASFCFAPGITEELERSLWQAGVLNWTILRKHSDTAIGLLAKHARKN